MTRFATLLIGSALTALTASYVFAADTAPENTQPAAASQPAPIQPPTTQAAAPAAVAPAAPAAVTPAPPAAPAAQASAPAADQQVPAAAGTKDIKLAYINLNRVATESPQGKDASAKFTETSKMLQAKLEAKQKQLEKHKEAIEAKIATMTPKERATKAGEFQKKVEEFQKLVRSSELEAVELQDKLNKDVYLSVRDVAVAYAKSNGYSIVVEEKSVLYLTDDLKPKDISDEIIKVLNTPPPAK